MNILTADEWDISSLAAELRATKQLSQGKDKYILHLEKELRKKGNAACNLTHT